MNRLQGMVVGCGVLGLLASTQPASAQSTNAPRAVTLQVAGSSLRGGLDFDGTVTINRFELERRGDRDRIVAIGFVQGVLRRGGHAVGTALKGEVTWPVIVRSGGVVPVSGGVPGAPLLRSVASSTAAATGAGPIPVQAASCPVVDIALGPNTINVLGVQIALGPAVLSLVGETGTPLGDLVCSVSDLIGQVAALVDVLNGILGLVTGLLGGLTGGLGGVLPAAGAGIG